jgi:hypothetical protein
MSAETTILPRGRDATQFKLGFKLCKSTKFEPRFILSMAWIFDLLHLQTACVCVIRTNPRQQKRYFYKVIKNWKKLRSSYLCSMHRLGLPGPSFRRNSSRKAFSQIRILQGNRAELLLCNTQQCSERYKLLIIFST